MTKEYMIFCVSLNECMKYIQHISLACTKWWCIYLEWEITINYWTAGDSGPFLLRQLWAIEMFPNCNWASPLHRNNSCQLLALSLALKLKFYYLHGKITSSPRLIVLVLYFPLVIFYSSFYCYDGCTCTLFKELKTFCTMQLAPSLHFQPAFILFPLWRIPLNS